MGKKVVKKKLESERFRADCELDVDAFSDILKRNISTEIRCLEENLNLFVKVVKSDRPGYLSRTALEQFVIKNRPDIKPEMVRAMKAVFDLNYMVTGEEPEYMSAGNVKDLIDIALLFNEKSSQYYSETFGNTTPNTPWSIHRVHQKKIEESAKAISVPLRKMINHDRNGEVRRLNILDLLESFTTEGNREEMEKTKKMLFLKKLIVGGSKEELTHTELDRVLLYLEPLITIALDAIRFKYLNMEQSQIFKMLNADLDSLNEMINGRAMGDRDRQVLFTIDEVIDLVRIFVDKNDFDVDKFSNIIREGKKIIMGGNTVEVRGGEMKTLFNHGKTILKSGIAFHEMYLYEPFSVVLKVPFPVRLNFDDYRHNYPYHQEELRTFARIVKNYRFFKGEFISAYYTTGHKRNANGVFEVYLYEYLLDLVFKIYGSPSPAPTDKHPFGYSIDQFQMQALIKKFKYDLVELGLLSPLWPTVTADNVSLLGTLFQYQSDENEVMDVNEATEFAIALFTSLNVSKDIMRHLKNKNCEFDVFGRVEPNCMRRNFFPAICNDYRKYLPLLFSSINTPKLCENIPYNNFNSQFIDRAIKAARPCNYYTDGKKEEIWITEADITAMMMVLMHAETTVLRWDTNGDNILDPDEVMKAYSIYASALDAFLETRPAIVKKFKKQIYLYLVKYEEVPDDKNFKSVWRFIKFLMSFKKPAPATRKTIASVLKSIGDENAKLPGAPKIDCNLLRDPDNLPDNHAQPATPAVDNRPSYSHLLEGYLNYID